jgi:tetratricopeptide (TPR) repeat protein
MLCLQELKASPTYASAHVVLGRAYLESGDSVKAEEEFHRVVELSPENLRARMHLGQICETQGRVEEAIGHYEKALEFSPLNREIRASLLRLRASISPSAPSVYPQASDVPGLPEPHAEFGSVERDENLFATETLADLYASQGLTDQAASIYRQLIDEQPFNEKIRGKLSALGERRQDITGTPVEPIISPPIDRLAEASRSESARVFGGSKEATAAGPARPLRMRREQILIEELERWLQGVRRCLELAAVRQ